MAIMYSDIEELKEVAKKFLQEISPCFSSGDIDVAVSTKKGQNAKLNSQGLSRVSGKTLYDEVMDEFKNIRNEIEKSGYSRMLEEYEHNKSTHKALAERFNELAYLIPKLHEEVLEVVDGACYDVIKQWNTLSEGINKEGEKSEIVIKGTDVRTISEKTSVQKGNKIVFKDKDVKRTFKNTDVNIMDYLSNDKNGFKNIFMKYKALRGEKIKYFEKSFGINMDRERQLLKDNKLVFAKVAPVTKLLTDKENFKKQVIEIAYTAGVITASLLAAIPTGGMSLGAGILFVTVVTGSSAVVLGQLKADLYTNLGSNGYALDGTYNTKANIEAREAHFREQGIIEGLGAGITAGLGGSIGRSASTALNGMGKDSTRYLYQISKMNKGRTGVPINGVVSKDALEMLLQSGRLDNLKPPLPQSLIDDIAKAATHNSNSKIIVFGKNSADNIRYVNFAKGRNARYFDTGDAVWKKLEHLDDSEIWRINKKSIDNALAKNKNITIELSHNPTKYLGEKSFYGQELRYLQDVKGYKFIEKGGKWYAVKK